MSTDWFTEEVLDEGERANVHLTMRTLGELAHTLRAYDPADDPETRRLVPLNYFYVPAWRCCEIASMIKFHPQKKTSKDVFFNVVEPGGFEPPSASTPLSVLHA